MVEDNGRPTAGAALHHAGTLFFTLGGWAPSRAVGALDFWKWLPWSIGVSPYVGRAPSISHSLPLATDLAARDSSEIPQRRFPGSRRPRPVVPRPARLGRRFRSENRIGQGAAPNSWRLPAGEVRGSAACAGIHRASSRRCVFRRCTSLPGLDRADGTDVVAELRRLGLAGAAERGSVELDMVGVCGALVHGCAG